MKRREFIAALGGAAAWPLAARAQQTPSAVRHIGILTNLPSSDSEGQLRISAFSKELQQLGWVDGGNVRIDTRWAAGNAESIRRYASELVAIDSSVVLATGSATVEALLRATRSMPIVFVNVPDPVGSGVVASLSRPGGNATGFTPYEYSTSGKWLELLKEIAPAVKRVAIIRDPAEPAGVGQAAAIRSAAPLFGVEIVTIEMRDAFEFERGIGAFARGVDGGLISVIGASTAINRELIIAHAAKHKLPAVYPYRFSVTSGGLISYGPDSIDQFRRAAGYVNRILKGEKPADLPVQAPTKYELAINLKTAKTLGLVIPPTLLARADDVVE